jgi:hypothetical protein
VNVAVAQVVDGWPVMKNEYLYANEKPGLGIEVNGRAAAKYSVSVGIFVRNLLHSFLCGLHLPPYSN